MPSAPPVFTFVHAADLHLGAPFRGLDAAASEFFSGTSGTAGALLTEAGFETLNRLEALCLKTNAAFLLLAGDIYDDRDGVLRARFALRDMFARLQTAGVQVLIAHGNHDPLPDKAQPVAWPSNVTVFGPSAQCVCVADANGVPLALVHGVSHAGPREKENLSARFVRYTPDAVDERFVGLPDILPPDIFQIAVLHCAVGGAGGGHAPYAPCTLTDLTGAGFDYWALGHVHQHRILSRDPWVVYPGSAQGLHINETGPHGCCAVRVEGREVSCRAEPLAPVLWLKLAHDLETSGARTIDELELSLLEALEEAARDAVADSGENGKPDALFFRVILTGGTALDNVLRKPGNLPALVDRLRKEAAGSVENGPGVWVKDVVLETRPERDMAALSARGDLAGEVARLAQAAADDPAMAGQLAARALEPLHGHHKLKKILGRNAEGDMFNNTDSGPGDASGRDPAALAASAGALLISLLEDD